MVMDSGLAPYGAPRNDGGEIDAVSRARSAPFGRREVAQCRAALEVLDEDAADPAGAGGRAEAACGFDAISMMLSAGCGSGAALLRPDGSPMSAGRTDASGHSVVTAAPGWSPVGLIALGSRFLLTPVPPASCRADLRGCR